MDTKKIFAAIVTAAAMTSASASNQQLIEKKSQAEVISKLLNGFSIVMSHPECTIRN
jgi:hypothetical protein